MTSFVEDLVERLGPVGDVRSRAMFGGHGIFKEDRMFMLVADDVAYFKVDNLNKSEFIEAQGTPFVAEMKGRSIEMSYWCVPGPLSDQELCRWAETAFAAAMRQPKKKRKPKK